LETGQLNGERLPVDFAANARSLGAYVIEAKNLPELKEALADVKAQTRTTVITIETDLEQRVPGYESWWDVAVAEVSELESVRQARENYEKSLEKERHYL
jgi:3D-(3,5/4)-trihydroxycyclohexane-1,2-dione acylhydrolase (decyclizing)